jgi:TonB family protein
MRSAVLNSIRVPLGMLLLLFMSPALLSQEPQTDKAESEKHEPASVPMAGTMGYSTPTCIKCPTAKFSKEAVKHKYEGTVTLRITVDETGHAKDIAVEKGLLFGLTEQAIATVKKWRLKPATGPDGKPAAVRMNVEVTFHLY